MAAARADPRRRQAGRPFTGRVRTAREDWIVFLPGLLPAYISIGQYEKNMQRMDANRSRSQSLGAVRDGPALLAGLVACGRCGKKMTVHYQRGPGGKLQPVYVCARQKSDYGGRPVPADQPARAWTRTSPICCWPRWRPPRWRSPWPRPSRPGPSARRSTGSGGSGWNAPISPPTGPAASTSSPNPRTAWSPGSWRKDWETALAERQRLGEEYDRFTAARPRTLTAAEREQIRALAADLPAVWNAPTTTDADRKQLIRHLIEQVRITVLGASEKVDVEVTWAGGHRTAAQITRPVACLTQLSYYPQLAARARELADGGCTTAQIAGRLNAEGFRPPKRIPAFTPNAVTDLLRALGIQRSHIPARRNRPALAQHEWWLRDLAEHLAMSEITLDSWVRRGWATGYLHPQARLRVVRADPAEVERLRALHHVPRGQHNRRPWLKNQAALNEHRTGRSPQRCRTAAAMTALRLARLKVETAQERLPQPVHLRGGGAGDGGPQPHRLGVPVAGQVIHLQADQGAFDDRQRAVVVQPGGAVGQPGVQPVPGLRDGGAVAGGHRARGHSRLWPGRRVSESEPAAVAGWPAVGTGLAGRHGEVQHPV